MNYLMALDPRQQWACLIPSLACLRTLLNANWRWAIEGSMLSRRISGSTEKEMGPLPEGRSEGPIASFLKTSKDSPCLPLASPLAIASFCALCCSNTELFIYLVCGDVKTSQGFEPACKGLERVEQGPGPFQEQCCRRSGSHEDGDQLF